MTASVVFTYNQYLGDRVAYLIPLSAIALDAALTAKQTPDNPDNEKRAPVFVFDSDAGQVKLQQVTFGNFLGNEVEVYDGLNAGDLVVSAGVPFLRDGMKTVLWSPRR